VPALLKKFHQEAGAKIIFGERTKRSREPHVCALYHLYRLLHRVLTGISVRVGNFSASPRSRCLHHARRRVRAVESLTPPPCSKQIPARCRADSGAPPGRHDDDGLRRAGRSRPQRALRLWRRHRNTAAGHDCCAARSGLLGIVSVEAAHIEAQLAIPGWATYTGGVVFLLLFQAAGLSFLLIFIILSARASLTFIPIRDYQYFIADVTQIKPE
jgi:hypothetical protein